MKKELTNFTRCDSFSTLDAVLTHGGGKNRVRLSVPGRGCVDFPDSISIGVNPSGLLPSNSNRHGAAIGNAPRLAYKRATLLTPRVVKMTDDPLKSVSVTVNLGAGRTEWFQNRSEPRPQTKLLRAYRHHFRCLFAATGLSLNKSCQENQRGIQVNLKQ